MPETLVAIDFFDRVDLDDLGPNWSVQTGTFEIDGDVALTREPPSPGGVGLFQAINVAPDGRVASTDGRNSSWRSRVTRPDNQAVDITTGIIFAARDPTLWSSSSSVNLVRQFEIGFSSAASEVFIRRRTHGGTTVNLFTQVVTWVIGESKELRVDVSVGGQVVDVFLDGVHIAAPNIGFVGAPGTTTGPFNFGGLFFSRPAGSVPLSPLAPPPPPQTPGHAKFDVFKIFDRDPTVLGSTPVNVEEEPTLVAEPVLTSITVAGEGASAGTLPVLPDTAWEETETYRTRRSRTVSAHVIRHPQFRDPRSTWRFTWNGRTVTEKNDLTAFFDLRLGAIGVFDYTPPETGVLKKMAFVQSSLTSKVNGPSAWDLDAVVVEIK